MATPATAVLASHKDYVGSEGPHHQSLSENFVASMPSRSETIGRGHGWFGARDHADAAWNFSACRCLDHVVVRTESALLTGISVLPIRSLVTRRTIRHRPVPGS
jgi:hypothetical protein